MPKVVHIAARTSYELTDLGRRALASEPPPMPDRIVIARRTRYELTDLGRWALDGAANR